MTFLSSLLNSLLQRGSSWLPASISSHADIFNLSGELLSAKGEVSGVVIARQILDSYRHLSDTDKIAFFRYLIEDMDIDSEAVIEALSAYKDKRDPDSYARFSRHINALRRPFFMRLNEAPHATYDLVSMRADLLRLMRTHADLAVIDVDLRHLLASWFNRGFLVLRPINWESPAHILEKIISYEAVHEIGSWDDLRNRLVPSDRCCFAFFHPAMPDEPLIFVEVALTSCLPNSIQQILAPDRDIGSLMASDHAVFYSISNCQKGLAGISFGHSLIKTVVSELGQTHPQIKHFVTLSPLPHFAKWLQNQDGDKAAAFTALSDEVQVSMGAAYLLHAKGRDHLPFDPVCRFHLSNGAMIHRVHAHADISKRGRATAFGLMVNYLYKPADLIDNHENFVNGGKIKAASKIREAARKSPLKISEHIDKDKPT